MLELDTLECCVLHMSSSSHANSLPNGVCVFSARYLVVLIFGLFGTSEIQYFGDKQKSKSPHAIVNGQAGCHKIHTFAECQGVFPENDGHFATFVR